MGDSPHCSPASFTPQVRGEEAQTRGPMHVSSSAQQARLSPRHSGGAFNKRNWLSSLGCTLPLRSRHNSGTSDGSLQALKLARPEDSSQGSQHPTFTHPTRTTRELAVHHREGLRTVSGLQLDDFLDHKRGCGP